MLANINWIRPLWLVALGVLASGSLIATERTPTSKREIAAMVEKAAVIAVVSVSYEETEIRFEVTDVLFSSQSKPAEHYMLKLPRKAPHDGPRRLTTLMFFPHF